MLSSEWSCRSLKCEGQQCGPVSASRDSVAVSKDDAGSPTSIKGEDVVVESGGSLALNIFSVSTNKPL